MLSGGYQYQKNKRSYTKLTLCSAKLHTTQHCSAHVYDRDVFIYLFIDHHVPTFDLHIALFTSNLYTDLIYILKKTREETW